MAQWNGAKHAGRGLKVFQSIRCPEAESVLVYPDVFISKQNTAGKEPLLGFQQAFVPVKLWKPNLYVYSSVGGLSLVIRKSYWKPNALEKQSKKVVWSFSVTVEA